LKDLGKVLAGALIKTAVEVTADAIIDKWGTKTRTRKKPKKKG